MGFLKFVCAPIFAWSRKMKKKIFVSMIAVALLLIGVMATSVLASNAALTRNTAVTELATQAASISPRPVPVEELNELTPSSVTLPDVIMSEDDKTNDDVVATDDGNAVDLDALRKAVPETYEETASRITQRKRFLMYTHDGVHIMWGLVGNGHFVGQDNLGKRCWGIYGNGIFAGFYDGEFFWGKYRAGNWKAFYLFGQYYSYGKYILFPLITAASP